MKNQQSQPIEIERKYIIKLPNVSEMEKMPQYTASDIEQIYLPSEDGETRRVRKRAYNDRTEYYETVKKRIDAISSIELERAISEREYVKSAAQIADGSRPIIKRRHTFLYKERTIEIDIYPEWKRSCIMEIELPDRSAVIELPEIVEIVKEVTGIRGYSNADMARAFPEEII